MHRFLDWAFGLSLFGLMAILVLGFHQAGALTVPVDPATYTAAGLVCVLLGLRRAVNRAKRPGLLNGRARLPLSREERMRMISANVAAELSAKDHLSDREHPESFVAAEIARLTQRWVEDRQSSRLSDDEVRSIFQLNMYADPSNALMQDERAPFLEDVADTGVFELLRAKVDAYWLAQAQRQEDERAWRAHIGDTSMAHLVRDGWVAFLESQPGCDPVLWQAIATGFSDLTEADRLDAAFWILEQPECDRAIASDFIRGFAANDLLEACLDMRDWPSIDRYRAVIDRYNAGFYRWHGIRANVSGIVGGARGGVFDTSDLIALFERLEGTTAMPRLPHPKALLDFDLAPGRPNPSSYESPYEVREGAGLHLKYPGQGWRLAS